MIDERLERQVELFISWLLRIGVMVSAALVIIGMAMSFSNHPLYRSSHAELGALTSASGIYPHTVTSVLRSVREGHGQGIAMLGLLLLIATPVFRVAVSVILFARERDVLFVVMTSTVLALLILSFILGAAGG
jgi:Predicted membrane protein